MTAVPGAVEPPEPLQLYWSKMPAPVSWTPSVDEVLPLSFVP
jgi:hypothetical protein